jgi:hypothetical protein
MKNTIQNTGHWKRPARKCKIYPFDSWGSSLMALKMQMNVPCELFLYILKIPPILLREQKRN